MFGWFGLLSTSCLLVVRANIHKNTKETETGVVSADGHLPCCCCRLQLSEADIIEKLENLCNVERDDGDWITHYDIVESGSTLKLEDKNAVSKA